MPAPNSRPDRPWSTQYRVIVACEAPASTESRSSAIALDPPQLAQPHHDAAHAAFEHEDVEAAAEDRGRERVLGADGEHARELRPVGRGRERIGRTADPERGVAGEGHVELDALGETVDQGLAGGGIRSCAPLRRRRRVALARERAQELRAEGGDVAGAEGHDELARLEALGPVAFDRRRSPP